MAALIEDAKLAINAVAEPEARDQMLKLLKADRKLLELMAARGQAMASYQASRRKHGLA